MYSSSDTGKKEIEFKTESAEEFISRGISCLKEGKVEDAVSNFSRGINLDPQKAVAYVARGSGISQDGPV